MTLEEAIKLLKQYQGYDPMFPDGETLKHAFDLTDETVDTLLSALRPVSREQVEIVWRGYWIHEEIQSNQSTTGYFKISSCECSKCGCYIQQEANFCPSCGATMTDEAVQMVMERLRVLTNDN